jgi:phosphoribosylanthranilate isomerase
MSVFVKICGLRDAETIAAAVDAGADAIGFVFADSVRKISVQDARDLARDIPAHVQKVAVMQHPSNEEWQAVCDTFVPDVLQTDNQDLQQLSVPRHISTWPVIREGTDAANETLPETFIYEGITSGVGATVDWSLAARISDRGRMILAGGLNPANVAAAIRATQPWGVDVSSGVESSRGKKDIELIRNFIGAVRATENEQ